MGQVRRFSWVLIGALLAGFAISDAHADDAQQCIASWRNPMNNGYIQWGLSNSCDFPVAFDIDYCDMAPSMQATCTVKTVTVSRNGDFSDSNYHQPANARNYRTAGSSTSTSSGRSGNSSLWNTSCPDHYFHAYPNGACKYCDAIWSDGHCIYD
jgi:hypothetical protein